MSAIRRTVNAKATAPQTVQSRPDQVRNNAGGYVYQVSDKDRLERFLILGTDGGTFHVGERDLTQENLSFVADIIGRDPQMVYHTTVAISDSGRAAKNTPAVYVAACFLVNCNEKDKALGRVLVNKVCRTSTHIFELCGFIDAMGGWGQAKMKAVRAWYTSKTRDQLAYQAIKYRGGRYGWTHRDVLRTVHPRGIDTRAGAFMLGKVDLTYPADDLITGFLKVGGCTNASQVLTVLGDYPGLPWETIPTQFLRDPAIWVHMVTSGAVTGTALIRNLKRMDEIGCFNDLRFAKKVADILVDPDVIRRARLHPVQYLNAMGALGLLGDRGVSCRTSFSQIVAAGLENGFYASFGAVPESNERVMVAVDVSGSMTWAAPSGLHMTCAQAATSLAMVIARRNPIHMIYGFKHQLTDLQLRATDGLEDAIKKTSDLTFGSTDCAQPMLYAAKHNLEVDKFVILTDNETWVGRVKPDTALRDYRRNMGIPGAKLIVVGMTTGQFSIADPKDPGMLDVVGFDTNIPALIRSF